MPRRNKYGLPGVVAIPGHRGRLRLYYRARSGRYKALPRLPHDHPDFLSAYVEARRADDGAPRPVAASLQEGTVAWLVDAYQRSPAWRRLARSTQYRRALDLDRIAEERGAAPLAGVQPKHIRRDLASLEDHPANHRLKAWRALYRWALEAGHVDEDPAAQVRLRAVRSDGHHTWTHEEIERARAAHEIGTKPRLMLELAYWTGARRSDLTHIGRQHVTADGWLRYSQDKTGVTVELPFTAPYPRLAADQQHLWAALDAYPTTLLFLETAQGRAHSVKGLGNWFHEHVAEPAGVGHCTLHGLRKRRAADLAETGHTAHQIMSWLGHGSPREGETYTRKADRRRVLEG